MDMRASPSVCKDTPEVRTPSKLKSATGTWNFKVCTQILPENEDPLFVNAQSLAITQNLYTFTCSFKARTAPSIKIL